MLIQTYSAGPLSGCTITNIYDDFLRRTNLSAFNGSNALTRLTYSYDSAGRLFSVFDGTNSATYTYVANSPLVGQIAFTNNGALRMTTTKQYDLLNRLTNISSSSSSFTSAFSYMYNSANQRIRRTETDSSYWVYQYDSLGQVISGKKYWSDGTPVAGQQFEYAFDDIGNRQSTKEGGDQWGANLRSASYSANNLNQYTSRTFPSYFNDLGTANSNAAVTLWSADGSYASTYRRSDYFRAELPVNNSTAALWLTLTNLAVLRNGTNSDILTNAVGNAFIPATPESFAYDADGNLTSDGRWTNHWDAENRLISIESLTNAPAGSKRKLLFTYDHQGRRIRKQSFGWNSGWSVVSDTAFVYDGWNLIAEVNATNGAPVRACAWGLDLSGTMQGAGGVGGLLWLNDAVQAVHFAVFDGNGNVAALEAAADGAMSASYEYGSFGEVIRATGQMAVVNDVRFSTKCQDRETDFLYYGYRYLNPTTGRWASRDPIEERGGLNTYALLNNRPVVAIDGVGLSYALDLFLTHLGFENKTNMSPSMVQDVIDSPSVQSFGQSVLSEARFRWSCGKSGHFIKSGGLNDSFNPKNSTLGVWRNLDWGLTGSWQLLVSGDCTWKCETCGFFLYSAPRDAACNRCRCTSTCKIAGSITKTYTFAYAEGGNTANFWLDLLGVVVTPVFPLVGAPVYIVVFLGDTYNIDQPFQTTVSESGSKSCL